jgi:integrase
MASIEAYETKKGRRYRVRYTKPDRKPTDRRGFRTKREAQIFLNTVEVSKLEGNYVDPARGKITVEELGSHWLKTVSAKASSKTVYETALRVHIYPKLGALPVNGVSRSNVREWVAQLSEKRAARTVRRAHYVLQAILQTAVDDHLISRNPASGLKNLPSLTHRKNVYLTYEQVEKVAQVADEHHLRAQRGRYGFVIYIAAYMGLRGSEIATLTPEDIVLDARRVRIRAEVSKNGRERSVGYPTFMHERFRALTLKASPGGLLMPDLAEPKNQESWFLSLRKKTKLDEGFVFHDLRHSAASFAVSAGASVKVVQNMLGHSSAAMTLDVYSDLFDTDVDDVAQRINDRRETALNDRSTGGHRAVNDRG